jgi:hypothetical protein
VTASDYAANTSTQSVTYVVDPAPGAPNQGPPSPTPSPAPQLLGSLTASRRGAVSLKLRCAAGRRCVGTVTLYAATGTARHRRQLKLGGAHYAIAAGRRHTLSLRLSHAALSLLRSAHGHLNVQLAIAPANGRIRTGSHRLTLSKH